MPPRDLMVVEDDEDAVPLSDLLRTGEASRLRRRGAMRATAHRRDDEEDGLLLPLPRGFKGHKMYLELECGVRSAECSFTPAGPSRPNPLPRFPSLRKPSDVGFVFSSTGCGAVISTRALPGSIAAHHVYTASEPVNSNIAHLHHRYLEPEQRALADIIMKDVPWCQCECKAIGCRVCGNALGLFYAACHSRHGNTSPTYVFFPSAVTPSPHFTFPPIQHPESDDMSVDSPTLSPRVTRYFRSDEDFWRSGTTNMRHFHFRSDEQMNPIWTPDPPTPPRSPPPAATSLAYAAWQAELAPAASAQTQARASHATDAPSQRESTQIVPVREPFMPHNDWGSFLRSVSPRRTERPPQNANEFTHSEELAQPPSDAGTTLPNEQRDRAPLQRPGVSRADTAETSSRPLDPPSLHRVSRRAMPPVTRRPTSLDWSGRGRHTSASDANSWVAQGSDEWFSRRIPPARRIVMPLPVQPPAPTFTLVDPFGERSYPPSARSSLDMQDTLGVSVEVETEEDMIAHWLMQEQENELPVERTWTSDPDGDNEDNGADDSEEKEEDLDERRMERMSRNDNARPESHSNDSRGLISR